MRTNFTPTQLVEGFEYFTSEIISATFPEKEVLIQRRDKPYFTEDLRKLRRSKMHEYSKNGKSQKFLKLQSKFKDMLEIEVNKYKCKLISQAKDGKEGRYTNC